MEVIELKIGRRETKQNISGLFLPAGVMEIAGKKFFSPNV